MFPREVAEEYYRAQKLYAEGKPTRALEILDRIGRASPNHPEIMHGRALCLYASGHKREALQVCNQLFTMHNDPRGLELHNRWQGDKADDALNAPFDTVIEVLPAQEEEAQPRSYRWVWLAAAGAVAVLAVAWFARGASEPAPATAPYFDDEIVFRKPQVARPAETRGESLVISPADDEGEGNAVDTAGDSESTSFAPAARKGESGNEADGESAP